MKTKEIQSEVFDTTVGLMSRHANLKRDMIVRVQYSTTNHGNIMLTAANENNIRIKCIKPIVITTEEFNNRNDDPYNSLVEFYWAINLLGFDI